MEVLKVVVYYRWSLNRGKNAIKHVPMSLEPCCLTHVDCLLEVTSNTGLNVIILKVLNCLLFVLVLRHYHYPLRNAAATTF